MQNKCCDRRYESLLDVVFRCRLVVVIEDTKGCWMKREAEAIRELVIIGTQVEMKDTCRIWIIRESAHVKVNLSVSYAICADSLPPTVAKFVQSL